MKTPLKKQLAIVAAIAGVMQTAQAVPQLRISDGVNPTVTISDNLGGDAQPAPGQVIWIGSIGNWTLNVHTGTTFPVIGSLANPSLDLSFNATSNGAGGTLTISFSADGFGPTNGSFLAQIGGIIATDGALTYTTYGGTNNTNFSTVNQLTAQGPFGAGAFSGAQGGGNIDNPGPYALTQVISITHAAGNGLQTTGDSSLVSVPDSGTSILLLSAGLTGIGWMAQIRRRFLV